MSRKNLQGRKASADGRRPPAEWKKSFGCSYRIDRRLHGNERLRGCGGCQTENGRMVGNNGRFYPHAAQFDFEAWLLPFWSDIQALAGHNKSAPPGPPEAVNHQRPPSHHICEIFRAGTCRDDYSKPRDAGRILRGKDLAISANKCPELKAFLNTILTLSGAEPL